MATGWTGPLSMAADPGFVDQQMWGCSRGAHQDGPHVAQVQEPAWVDPRLTPGWWVVEPAPRRWTLRRAVWDWLNQTR